MKHSIQITIVFHSYCRELAGVDRALVEIPEGATVDELFRLVMTRYPKLVPMQKSLLIAIGVEYAAKDQTVKDGDEVSLFPPVQGG